MSPCVPQYLTAINGSSMDHQETPMSRTHQYRKVMKPLLERKRRARINKCLDELKDLMVFALQAEGESITKLEKADVLELTVNHLRKLKKRNMLKCNSSSDSAQFNSGFTACANEVGRCLSSVPGIDLEFGSSLMSHLGGRLNDMEASKTAPLSVSVPQPQTVTHHEVSSREVKHRTSSVFSDAGYSSGRDSVSPRREPSHLSSEINVKQEPSAVWRPF